MMIAVKNLRKVFGEFVALEDVSFELTKGQVLALIGPSGSGKSTLLRCLNRMALIDDGSVSLLDGEFVIIPQAKIDERLLRQKVGMVFQGFNLWSHRTVLENLIEAPMCVLKMGRFEATARAQELLAKVRLSEKESRYPATLSGGEQQRVAIARAMMMGPQVLLLDEITSALDPELVWEVLEVVKDVVSGGTTVIMATHHINFAREIADQVIFLDKGVVVESGTEVLTNPQHPRTKEFLRRVLAGKV